MVLVLVLNGFTIVPQQVSTSIAESKITVGVFSKRLPKKTTSSSLSNKLLNNLNTRVVVPMCYLSSISKKHLTNVSPVFKIKGRNCVMLTPQLAAIPLSDLGSSETDLSENRSEIIAALDFLITGF